MSDEPKLAAWQYYYKDNACPAEYSRSENCICWHNEGSGPFPKLKNGDDIPLAYGGAFGLTWRRVPAPAVPDDVAGVIADCRHAVDALEGVGAFLTCQGILRQAADALEAQAAELARLRGNLELERAFTDGAHRRARAADAHTAAQPAPERNWTEDYTHENGNYVCVCWDCKQEFIGHKRRVTCKDCATSQPAPDAVAEADDALLSDAYIAMRDAMGVIDANEGPGMKHSRILNALADARVRIERRTSAKGPSA